MTLDKQTDIVYFMCMVKELTTYRHEQVLLDIALGTPVDVVADTYELSVSQIYKIVNDEENKRAIESYQNAIERSKIQNSINRIERLRDKIEENIDAILEQKLSCVTQDVSWSVKDKAATDLLKWYGLVMAENTPDDHKTPQCVIVVNRKD